MGRHPKIERAVALDRAMHVFWTQGYTASGVEDLQNAMGLQRGSFYFLFSSKKALFLEVLKTYRQEIVIKRQALVEGAPTGMAGIRIFFNEIVNHSARTGSHPGCLNTSTAIELGSSDPEIADFMKAGLRRWERFWVMTLERAQADGSLKKSKNVQEIAKQLVVLTQGLNVLGKVNQNRAYLRSVMKAGLSVLD